MAKLKFNLATLIFMGFGLGVATGLFFGDYCEYLQPIGNGFLLLLQMGVLPYIMCALIYGIGKLSISEAISLAKKVGSFILVLWGIAFVVILAMAQTYPEFESAPFFSQSMIESVTAPNFLQMYIPANPFQSLANSMVPAVVLFSIVVGIALIGIEEKRSVLDFVGTMTATMLRVMGMVIKLSPIGIFAITANAAGTMEGSDLGKLQIYLIGYLAFWGLLCFWILPTLVTTLTPFSYRDVIHHYRDVLITAFATGSLFIVLPLMAQRSRELFAKRKLDGSEADTAIDVVVGTSFNFPDLGKLLTLSFIPFAAWFVGSPLSIGQYPSYLMAGLFSFFGDVVMAMIFLLDFLRIPTDTFNLFIVADVPISRFGTMLAAMHTMVLTLLCASASVGVLRLKWTLVSRYAGMTIGLVLVMAIGLRLLGMGTFQPEQQSPVTLLEIPRKMSDTIGSQPVRGNGSPQSSAKPGQFALQRIRESGVLRAGYRAGNFPFSYYTKSHGLVGFDAEMAQILAKDLGAKLELVPVTADNAAKKLDSGEVDVVMSGMVMTPERIATLAFPTTHMDVTAAFVVRDHRREEFSNQDILRAKDELTIGVLDIPYYVEKLKDFLPHARFEILDNASDFFARDDLDAMFYSAESGSAWCILHPSYTVAIPKPEILKLPVGYPVAARDKRMHDFMTAWIELKSKENTIGALYEHWVLGQGAQANEPRWSVIRNILHWVD